MKPSLVLRPLRFILALSVIVLLVNSCGSEQQVAEQVRELDSVELSCRSVESTNQLAFEACWGELTALNRRVIVLTDESTWTDDQDVVFYDMGGPIREGVLFEKLLVNEAERLALSRVVSFVDEVQAPSDECLAAAGSYYTAILHEQQGDPDDFAASCELEAMARRYLGQEVAAVTTVLQSTAVVPNSYSVVGSSFAAARWEVLASELLPEYLPTNVRITAPFVYGTNLTYQAQTSAETIERVWDATLKGRCSPTDCFDLDLQALRCLENCAAEIFRAQSDVTDTVLAAGMLGASYDLRTNLDALPQSATLSDDLERFAQTQLGLNAFGVAEKTWPLHVATICIVTTGHTQSDTETLTPTRLGVEKVLASIYAPCASLPDSPELAGQEEPMMGLWCYVSVRPDSIAPPVRSMDRLGPNLPTRVTSVAPRSIVNHGEVTPMLFDECPETADLAPEPASEPSPTPRQQAPQLRVEQVDPDDVDTGS